MKDACEICYKIVCKQCGWEAEDDDVARIQKGDLRACPVCQWNPKNS